MLAMFKQAWKGEASLAKAFWLIYVVIGILLGMLITLVIKMSVENFDYIVYNNLIMAIGLPYTLYSAISVWRCGKNSWVVWSILSKIVVVLGVLGSLMALVHLVQGV